MITGFVSSIGTFVAEGSGFQEYVCCSPSSRPDLVSEEALNQKLSLMTGGTKGGEALKTLRRSFLQGANRSEARLMMLSQLDIIAVTSDPARSPFTAALL